MDCIVLINENYKKKKKKNLQYYKTITRDDPSACKLVREVFAAGNHVIELSICSSTSGITDGLVR